MVTCAGEMKIYRRRVDWLHRRISSKVEWLIALRLSRQKPSKMKDYPPRRGRKCKMHAFSEQERMLAYPRSIHLMGNRSELLVEVKLIGESVAYAVVIQI